MINENNLRNTIGVFIVISNMLMIIAVFVFYISGGFLFDEMTTSISLIAPMFSIYTTLIIKNIVANKNKTISDSKVVTKTYGFIAFLMPSVFILFMLIIIALKAFNIGFASFEQFKTTLALGETVFGAYVGMVFSPLFESK